MPFVHSCWKPGCGKFGCYGRGVELRRGKPGEWACPDHVWPDFQSHRLKRPAAAEGATSGRRGVMLPPSGFQKQGQLL